MTTFNFNQFAYEAISDVHSQAAEAINAGDIATATALLSGAINALANERKIEFTTEQYIQLGRFIDGWIKDHQEKAQARQQTDDLFKRNRKTFEDFKKSRQEATKETVVEDKPSTVCKVAKYATITAAVAGIAYLAYRLYNDDGSTIIEDIKDTLPTTTE